MRNLRRRLYRRHEGCAFGGLHARAADALYALYTFRSIASIFPSKISHFQFYKNRTGENKEIPNLERIKARDKTVKDESIGFHGTSSFVRRNNRRGTRITSLKRRVNIPFLTSRKKSFGESLRARGRERFTRKWSNARGGLTLSRHVLKNGEREKKGWNTARTVCFARYCLRRLEYLCLRVISVRFERYLLYHYNCNEILRNVTDRARVRSRLLHNGGSRPLIASRD